jgi:nucleoside diphosphate kinase
MTSGPSCVVALTRGELGQNIIREWRSEIMKPESAQSLRAMYGTDHIVNALHGSTSLENAAEYVIQLKKRPVQEKQIFHFFYSELALLFPTFVAPKITEYKNHRTLAIVRPSAVKTFGEEDILKRIDDHGFKVAMMKHHHMTRQQAEKFYSEHKQNHYYEDLVNEMSRLEFVQCPPNRELILKSLFTQKRSMYGYVFGKR